MKKIEAIFRQEKLNDVKTALWNIGIRGLNVFEVRGHGRQGGIEGGDGEGGDRLDLLPRLQLNIILSDHNVDRVVDAIIEATHTGEIGDGMIFVLPVQDVVRVRTGERGLAALRYPGDIDQRR
jgi:nitrogen regulatory protein P-II 1